MLLSSVVAMSALCVCFRGLSFQRVVESAVAVAAAAIAMNYDLDRKILVLYTIKLFKHYCHKYGIIYLCHWYTSIFVIVLQQIIKISDDNSLKLSFQIIDMKNWQCIGKYWQNISKYQDIG